jgi:hypothetical protein
LTNLIEAHDDCLEIHCENEYFQFDTINNLITVVISIPKPSWGVRDSRFLFARFPNMRFPQTTSPTGTIKISPIADKITTKFVRDWQGNQMQIHHARDGTIYPGYLLGPRFKISACDVVEAFTTWPRVSLSVDGEFWIYDPRCL